MHDGMTNNVERFQIVRACSKFAPEKVPWRRGPVTSFERWKFPEMGVERPGRSLSKEPLAFAFDGEGNEISRGGFWTAIRPGQFFDPVLGQCPAVGSDWALAAFREFRRTNQRAKFHQGLV